MKKVLSAVPECAVIVYYFISTPLEKGCNQKRTRMSRDTILKCILCISHTGPDKHAYGNTTLEMISIIIEEDDGLMLGILQSCTVVS